MDTIKIEWKKQSGEAHILPNRQYTQQQSILKLDSQEKKPKKKKVQFKFRTSTPKVQAFENTKHTHSKTDRLQRSIFEEHDYTSRSTNSLTAELVETDDKQICSSRSKIITIIIVMIIILTVAVVVGVIVGVSKSQQSILDTTTIDNQTSLSTTTLVSSISIGNQSGPPCSSYTTIDDPSRNAAQSSLFGSCDNGSPFNASNGGSWIRFIGTGGTIISLAAPAQGHCGAYVGGWFNGTLPTTVGTVVNGTVCFVISPYSCLVFISISVINCSGFYVYFLPPVSVCNARYCTT
ncbi:unnamed protein product [Rotaria sp. Silwood1]|nr:unnamed protein product [Rotaria sp. Silwood1]CAF3581626.1 unnamed protein product [Rotaria sp. Silwood1]